MQVMLDRRKFLAMAVAVVVASVGAAAWPGRGAAETPVEPLTVSPLAEALFLIEGAGANVVVAVSPEELVLVDGGAAERTADLLALVEERWPGRKIAALVNTNWRPEHTGSNAALAERGTRIVAHENTKLWLGGDFRVEWESRDYAPQPAKALPTETSYTSGTLELAGEIVEYVHLPRAHTDGDLYVRFPTANVVVASDLLAVGAYPTPDYATGGWIGGFEDATRKLLDRVDDDTRIVPAHGAPQTKAALEDQLELLTAVRERVAAAFRNGMSFADFVATEPTKEFDAARGDPALFLALVHKGAWAHLRELGGVI